MRVLDIREEWQADHKRALATVVWERRKTPPQDIFVEMQGENASMLRPQPNAFLVGALMPARYHFERRILVEGTLCPLLVHNLTQAMGLSYGWYKDARPIEIEGDIAPVPFKPSPTATSAVMFSGVLDSIASVAARRRNHDEADPESFDRSIRRGTAEDHVRASWGVESRSTGLKDLDRRYLGGVIRRTKETTGPIGSGRATTLVFPYRHRHD